MSTSSKHISELDGLRGVAILMVLATHLVEMHDLPHPTAVTRLIGLVAGLGWSGVDLFFALSGFLITGILLETRRRPGYFAAFYARRTLRIFPLYYTFLLVVIAVLPRLSPETFQSPTPGQWMYWTYASNFVRVKYEYTLALSVTWSLAIEEQFYLVWPTVVWFVSRRPLVWICGLLMATAVAYRGVAVVCHWGGKATYYYTLSRMDGLAAGALAAVVIRTYDMQSIRRQSVRVAGLLLLPITALIALAQLRHLDVRSAPASQVLLYTLTSAFGAAAVLWVVAARPRIFSSAALRIFGKYSYSLYLFNMPVRMVANHLLPGHTVPSRGTHPLLGTAVYAATCVAVTLVLSIVSWRILEMPMLRLKRYFPEPDDGLNTTVGPPLIAAGSAVANPV